MNPRKIYEILSDALIVEKSEAVENALKALRDLHNGAIIVMESNGLSFDDYAVGPIEIVYSEDEARALCAENPNRFYYSRLENGKFCYV